MSSLSFGFTASAGRLERGSGSGPLVGLVVYIAGCTQAMRRPWRWPLATAVALLSVAAVGLLAVATGVRFES
jgi:hypothetical protein